MAYRQGIKDSVQKDNQKPLQPIFNAPRKPKTVQDGRLAKLIANIDNYDGTKKGQEVIK